MDCCKTNTPMGLSHNIAPAGTCSICGAMASGVLIRTLFHHVNPGLLRKIQEHQEYWFCNNSECAVLYFGQDGTRFYAADLREHLWVKTPEDMNLAVCNCFGYSAAQILSAALTKSGKVSQEIREYIQRGLCECEIRNPSGKCCLGNVLSLEKVHAR